MKSVINKQINKFNLFRSTSHQQHIHESLLFLLKYAAEVETNVNICHIQRTAAVFLIEMSLKGSKVSKEFGSVQGCFKLQVRRVYIGQIVPSDCNQSGVTPQGTASAV